MTNEMVRVIPATVDGIKEAVRVLQDGGLVGLPTETVYGLAADAEQPDAVARIYAAKGRPHHHPLIVHIADASSIDQWAVEIPAYARILVDHLWPGPLTVVLKRSRRVEDHITGGQDTVALRSPAHPVAAAVLREFDGGIAAPSANRFGRVSPTTADHVMTELGEYLHAERDIILDGGASSVGLESTIVDCTAEIPRILRPGAIGHQRLSDITGLPVAPFEPHRDQEAPRVSGTLDSHYSPSADVIISLPHAVDENLRNSRGPHGLIAFRETPTPRDVVRLLDPETADEYAAGLYGALRQADALNLQTVIAVPPHHLHDEVAAAIIDRLTRAAFRE